MPIDNGQRVRVEIGTGRGRIDAAGGLQAIMGQWQVAFPGRVERLARETVITIDGVDFPLVALAASDFVKGMVVATVEPPAATPEPTA